MPTGPPTDTAGVAVDLPPFRVSATLRRSEAIARAIDLSPTTARAGAVVRIARSAERVAYGEYLPSLSVNSSVLRNGTPVLGSSPLSSVIGPTGIGTTGTPAGTDSSGITSAFGGGSSGSSGTSSPSSTVGPLLSRGVRAPVGQTVGSGGSGGSGGSSGGSSTTSPTGSAAVGTSAYMTVVAGYDVFTGGRRSADNRRARAETRAAEAFSISQRFAVVEQVETVFYDVRRAEDLEAVALAQVRRAAEDARQAGRRRAVGTATPADVLQFELLLNNARVAYAQAAIQRRASAYTLGRLTGVPGAVEARIDTAIIPRPLALADTAIVLLALRDAPTLVAARDSARAAEAGITAARAQYFPTIRLGTSYTMAPNGLAITGARPGWAVALTTSYPIFNGGVREYDYERATAASQLAQVTASDAEREARSEVERRLGNIALTAQQVRLSQTAVQVARESYRVQNVRYGAGVATVLDLSNAEQQLTQAEQQLVNATYDYALARTSLNAFVGREL
ncbi:MAG TPA: TolC family protein [Gemmatirosa sp.]